MFRYALPVQKGVAVASTKDWDDFGLWTRVFAARGWHETKQRNTVEYGLEFRAQLAPASQGPEINISPTNSERCEVADANAIACNFLCSFNQTGAFALMLLCLGYLHASMPARMYEHACW